MSESNVYKLLKKHLCSGSDQMNRVENLISSGWPDVFFCFEGVQGWIEIKCPTEPITSTPMLFRSNHSLTAEQKNWFLMHKRAGCRCFILICTNLQWFLMDGWESDMLHLYTVGDFIEKSIWHARKPLKKEDWVDLKEVLLS